MRKHIAQQRHTLAGVANEMIYSCARILIRIGVRRGVSTLVDQLLPFHVQVIPQNELCEKTFASVPMTLRSKRWPLPQTAHRSRPLYAVPPMPYSDLDTEAVTNYYPYGTSTTPEDLNDRIRPDDLSAPTCLWLLFHIWISTPVAMQPHCLPRLPSSKAFSMQPEATAGMWWPAAGSGGVVSLCHLGNDAVIRCYPSIRADGSHALPFALTCPLPSDANGHAEEHGVTLDVGGRRRHRAGATDQRNRFLVEVRVSGRSDEACRKHLAGAID